MKHLPYFIFESLFDTDIASKSTYVVDKYLWDMDDSDLWKFLQFRKFSNFGEFTDKKMIINEPVVISNKKSDSDLKNPLGGKYDFYAKGLTIETFGDVELKDNLGFASIDVGGELRISSRNGKLNLENCDFNIKASIPRINDADYIKFKNVSINFDQINSNSYIVFNGIFDEINLTGLSSNAIMLYFYGASIFSWAKDKFDKFFGKEPLILNDGTTKNKSMRNIGAVINNLKKYGTLDPINFKPERKITDLININLNDFKNVEQMRISDNNIVMTFVKESSNNMTQVNAVQKYARYVRFNNMNKYKDYSLGDMVELVRQCVTPDGWIVMLEKKYF